MQTAQQAKEVKVNNQITSVLALAPKEPVMMKVDENEESKIIPTKEIQIILQGLPSPIMQKWETATFTINQFFIHCAGIDLKPIEQRNSVDKNKNGTHSQESKSQGIIDTILKGMDIGEVAFEVRVWKNGKWKSISEHSETQSGDGGHRCRSIVAFMRNHFHTHHTGHLGKALYYKDLPKVWKDHIGNYVMRTVVHYALSSRDIGKNMYQANLQTPPVFIETVNYWGTLAQLSLCRDLVYGPHPAGDRHELFTEKKDIPTFLGFQDTRMKWLEFCVESALLHEKQEFTSVTHAEIWAWMEKEFKKPQLNGLKNKLQDECDYYYNLARAFKRARGAKPNIMIFHLFRMTYWIFKELSPRFSTNDVLSDDRSTSNGYDKIAEGIIEADNTFSKENAEAKWQDENGDYYEARYKFVADAFHSYVKKMDNEWKVTQAFTWFKSAFKITPEMVLVKSKTGRFTTEQMERRWSVIGKIDEVDLKPIALKDVVGCHIIAEANGGSTEDDNLMISKEIHNQAMGTTNGEDYARMFQQANSLEVRELPKI